MDADQVDDVKIVASANTIAMINAAAEELSALIDQIRRGWPETAAEVATKDTVWLSHGRDAKPSW